MLLGFSRGSIGDLTFYRRNSQQVTRARARVVKNPKTLKQQMQRAIMRTSVEAYKVIKEICDHSFEGVAYGANSYAEFQRQNMAMLRRLAAAGGEHTKSFLPMGFNGLVAMPWVLSKGSIGWKGATSVYFSGSGGTLTFDFGNVSATQVDEVTYKQFADALGAREGDQITLIAFKKRADIDESSCMEPVIARIILSPSGTAHFDSAPLCDDNGKIELTAANPLNENTDAFTFQFQTGRLLCSLQESSSSVGGAIICSRRASDGSWLRSPSIMAVNDREQDGGYSLRQASMVVSSDITTPSDWYLNNANEGSGE